VGFIKVISKIFAVIVNLMTEVREVVVIKA
jgi:hypothetical protein